MTDGIEDSIRDRASSEVVGVTGTPFPGRSKEPLLITFRFSDDGGRVTFSDDFERAIQRKIAGRPEYDGARVTYHKSGSSSAVPFPEQAATVKIPGERLPIKQSDIERFKRIMNREAGVETEEVYYDMVGK